MPAPSDLHTPTTHSVAAYVKRNTARVKKILAGMGQHGPAVSVRETDHKGHHIVIRTSYEIRVDGRPVMGHSDEHLFSVAFYQAHDCKAGCLCRLPRRSPSGRSSAVRAR